MVSFAKIIIINALLAKYAAFFVSIYLKIRSFYWCETLVKAIQGVTSIEESVDGNDAFIKISNNKYDLVILDILMPGMSGLDVLHRMRDRHNQTPILIFSFYPQSHYAIRAYKLGASGYLSKDSDYEGGFQFGIS